MQLRLCDGARTAIGPSRRLPHYTLPYSTSRSTARRFDSAADAAERRMAAQRFRATSWNTPVVNVQERLRSGKREEPPE